MSNIRSVTVFCASRLGNDPQYAELAFDLGCMIAEENIKLLYGGGGNGLMGKVAAGAGSNGGQVVGIMPELFRQSASGAPDSAKTIFTPDMLERKKQLIEGADVILVLPGGVGTLDEIFETVIMNYINMATGKTDLVKPLIMVDPKGLYEPLMTVLQDSAREGLSDPSVLKTITFVKTSQEARVQLQQWNAEMPSFQLDVMPEMKADVSTTPPQRPALRR